MDFPIIIILIWKINSNTVSEGAIMREFESALKASSVLDALHGGLRSAHIAFEVDVAPKFGNRHFG